MRLCHKCHSIATASPPHAPHTLKDTHTHAYPTQNTPSFTLPHSLFFTLLLATFLPSTRTAFPKTNTVKKTKKRLTLTPPSLPSLVAAIDKHHHPPVAYTSNPTTKCQALSQMTHERNTNTNTTPNKKKANNKQQRPKQQNSTRPTTPPRSSSSSSRFLATDKQNDTNKKNNH